MVTKLNKILRSQRFGKGEIFRMKDEILKLKPMCMDGCLGAGASQDNLVGLHRLTTLTDQSHINELLLISRVSKG